MRQLITDARIVELRKSRSTISFTPKYAWQDGAMDVRDIYEAERAKLLSAVQELVNRAVRFGHASDCDGFGYESMDTTGLFLCQHDKEHGCGLANTISRIKENLGATPEK